MRKILVSFLIAVLIPSLGFASPRPLPNELELPWSVAMIDDSYHAPGSSRTVILIQDAHTNESAQMNIAETLSIVLETWPHLESIYLEAGSGDESLFFLKPLSPQERREKIGLQFLKAGRLQGSEYFDLVSDQDVQLWGVEDMDLYREALDLYREVNQKRAYHEAYLKRLSRSFDMSLAPEEDKALWNRNRYSLQILKRLAKLSIIPDEYELYLATRDTLNIHSVINLLQTVQPGVELPPAGFEEFIKLCEAFYHNASRRDFALLHGMFEKMSQEGQSESVLIAGGFHAKHLKELLREKGVSYVSILPMVYHLTDEERYQNLILDQEIALMPLRLWSSGKIYSLAYALGVESSLVMNEAPRHMGLRLDLIQAHTKEFSPSLSSALTN